MKRILTFTILLGLLLTTKVCAEPTVAKIAVVDLQKIVNQSSQIKSLKASQEAKSKELSNLIKKAQTDIEKQTDVNKKKALVEKYDKELNTKRESITKEYTQKLKDADNNLTTQITKKATELGYNVILPKNTVIFGGDDITDKVLKVIK